MALRATLHFHLNLAYSAIEVEVRGRVVQASYEPLLGLCERLPWLELALEAPLHTLELLRELAPDWLARLRAAEILWEKLGCLEEARAEYEKLLETYPKSEWREIAEARFSSMRAWTGRAVSASPSSRDSAISRSPGAAPRTSASSSRSTPNPRVGE